MHPHRDFSRDRWVERKWRFQLTGPILGGDRIKRRHGGRRWRARRPERGCAEDDAANILCEHGITPTAQRIDIAAVLFERPQHVCAEDLQQILARNGTPVSKATVYNTLGLFARTGLVRELFVDSDKVLYDSNYRAPRSHLRCRYRCSDRHRTGSDRAERTTGSSGGNASGTHRRRHQDRPATPHLTDSGAVCRREFRYTPRPRSLRRRK